MMDFRQAFGAGSTFAGNAKNLFDPRRKRRFGRQRGRTCVPDRLKKMYRFFRMKTGGHTGPPLRVKDAFAGFGRRFEPPEYVFGFQGAYRTTEGVPNRPQGRTPMVRPRKDGRGGRPNAAAKRVRPQTAAKRVYRRRRETCSPIDCRETCSPADAERRVRP